MKPREREARRAEAVAKARAIMQRAIAEVLDLGIVMDAINCDHRDPQRVRISCAHYDIDYDVDLRKYMKSLGAQ